MEHVTVAILAKDKAHTLPIYLKCLQAQTYPKDRLHIYIRTNNNNDDTTRILREFVTQHAQEYAEMYMDDSDVPEPVQNYKPHEWNSQRFKVLGKIRQDSVNWAKSRGTHYFVCDCDNFIKPNVIEEMVRTRLPIVAPLLHTADTMYSNYHAEIDANGYYQDTPIYAPLWRRDIKGLVQVPVVHCTYLVRSEYLDRMGYDDDSGRYEYVIFSASARKAGIPQYLDTREMYGRITFKDDIDSFFTESWLIEFL
jgi:glycosyltransferase involved in cell wall biosynthesis